MIKIFTDRLKQEDQFATEQKEIEKCAESKAEENLITD